MEEDQEKMRKVVRSRYGEIASKSMSCCGPATSCCGGADTATEMSKMIGYDEEDLAAVPEGANLGLGCGNPVALASLQEGETILDLGSGAGLDCLLAAEKVGSSGMVIGVDMTPAMLDKARENARKGDYKNVEFRLGEIEHLPAADASVDVIISNCVINLSPDKDRVFQEAFRVLRPGGRLMVSDIVLLEELPDFIKNSIEAYVGCVSGALLKDEYITKIQNAGFQEVNVISESVFNIDLFLNDPIVTRIIETLSISKETVEGIAGAIVSISLEAKKA